MMRVVNQRLCRAGITIWQMYACILYSDEDEKMKYEVEQLKFFETLPEEPVLITASQ